LTGSLPAPRAIRSSSCALRDHDVGQADVSAAGSGLRRLHLEAALLCLLDRLTDLDRLAVEVDVPPAERQDLTEPHPGEERDDRPSVHLVAG
jgi:hypothetical protein